MVSLYRCIVVTQTALIKHSVNTYEEDFLCDASMSASLVVICVKFCDFLIVWYSQEGQDL